MKNASIDLEKEKENKKTRSNLSEAARGYWLQKLKEQKSTVNNL